MASQLYSTTEAAAYLGVHRRRVLQYVEDGRLQGRKTSAGYVFEQDELDRLKASIRPYRRRSGDTDGERT